MKSRFPVLLTQEYETFARKGAFDFYGYTDALRFFGGGGNARGIRNHGSPLFMEIEPRLSFDKLTGALGRLKSAASLTTTFMTWVVTAPIWYMGLDTDIDTGLPVGLLVNVYAKYQWENYGAANEVSWDGYRLKVKYVVPMSELWGGKLSYAGFTNVDRGSDLGVLPNRTSYSIASSHILSLNYSHWRYAFAARYFHNGGQWEDGAGLNVGKGDFNMKSTGQGYYRVAGYNF
ncbi:MULTISPECIES: outer membrane protein OmpK [Tenebrionibacter/Tenebrionicola group]|uniref:outer membrane protein OmpK n=1 Tax=Tenebrionibacter/Tenebrionicola group TaxID=2969848 RepID=UPI00295ECFA6|nr:MULTISPECIES: outer membrane protein OmpK [Tenebrionibacter/Tenebrionicola group]